MICAAPGAAYPPCWPDTPDVRAFLATQTRIDPARSGFFGHWFGGLFTLWLPFTRPEAFSHWIAASP